MAKRKTELQTRIDQAVSTGSYMVAIFTQEGSTLHLYRLTEKFPVAFFDEALNMLHRDVTNQNESRPPK